MDFATREPIKLRSGADYWGPFAFDLAAGLPPGDTLQSVTVQSFLDAAETTANLIETGSVNIVGSVVSLRLQYPGDLLKGNHTLRFNATCVTGAAYPFQFDFVVVT